MAEQGEPSASGESQFERIARALNERHRQQRAVDPSPGDDRRRVLPQWPYDRPAQPIEDFFRERGSRQPGTSPEEEPLFSSTGTGRESTELLGYVVGMFPQVKGLATSERMRQRLIDYLKEDSTLRPWVERTDRCCWLEVAFAIPEIPFGGGLPTWHYRCQPLLEEAANPRPRDEGGYWPVPDAQSNNCGPWVDHYNQNRGRLIMLVHPDLVYGVPGSGSNDRRTRRRRVTPLYQQQGDTDDDRSKPGAGE